MLHQEINEGVALLAPQDVPVAPKIRHRDLNPAQVYPATQAGAVALHQAAILQAGGLGHAPKGGTGKAPKGAVKGEKVPHNCRKSQELCLKWV